MKLYTKRGDDGQTDLIGGARVPKDDAQVQAYGSVDELNAALGLALACCDLDEVAGPLITVQGDLFELGAQLATAPPSRATGTQAGALDSGHAQAPSRIGQAHVQAIEQQIDIAQAELEPLRRFILPGGCELSARLHLARTVCRRAERDLVALVQQQPVDSQAVIYLNRLADLLFAQARLANARAGVDDVCWAGGG